MQKEGNRPKLEIIILFYMIHKAK